MRWTLSSLPDGVVRIAFDAVFSESDLVEALVALPRTEGWVAGSPLLLSFLGVRELETDAGSAARISIYLTELSATLAFRACAFEADHIAIYGMARACEQNCVFLDRDVRAFRSHDQAVAWLLGDASRAADQDEAQCVG